MLREIPRFLPLSGDGDLRPMKCVVWGGFILLGLPNILGFTIVVGLASLLLRLKPRADGEVVLRFVDVMGGFATLFVGLLIERLFSSRPTGWLPLVATIWFAVHFLRLKRMAEFARASVGVFSAWLLYCRLERV